MDYLAFPGATELNQLFEEYRWIEYELFNQEVFRKNKPEGFIYVDLIHVHSVLNPDKHVMYIQPTEQFKEWISTTTSPDTSAIEIFERRGDLKTPPNILVVWRISDITSHRVALMSRDELFKMPKFLNQKCATAHDEPTQEWQKEAVKKHNAVVVITALGWKILYQNDGVLGEHTWEDNMQAWEWLHTNGNQRRTLMS